LCLLAVLGAAALPALGDNNPTAPVVKAPSVEQLIERLGSPDFKTREAASHSLAALGVSALPALRKAQDHADPEVRRRLDELIPALEASASLEPRRVTLRTKNKPLKEILAEVTSQTGYKIQLLPDTSQRDKLVHSFDFANVPFWHALERVCAATGLALQQNYYADDVIRLQAADQAMQSPFVHHNGAFRLVAQGFSYGRSIQFGNQLANRVVNQLGQRGSEYLSFSFSIGVEPRLPLLSVGQVRLTLAEDEHKNSFLPPPVNNGNGVVQRFYYGGGYRTFSQHVNTNLIWPAKDARTIKLLRGVVPVTLLAEQKPLIVVENVLKAKGGKYQAGGLHLEVDDVGEAPKGMVFGNGKAYNLKLSFRETKPENPNDYTWAHTLSHRLELLDEKGNKYVSRNYNWTETTPTSVKGATFTFVAEPVGNQPIGPPAKLVYHNWIKRDHEVEFEFRDLPLP
jgi:hypothetical protein